MADCAAIKTQLDAVTSAYNKLIGGAISVIQDSDRSRVEYGKGDMPRLYAQMALLQAQYDACVKGGCAKVVLTRPLNFLF